MKRLQCPQCFEWFNKDSLSKAQSVCSEECRVFQRRDQEKKRQIISAIECRAKKERHELSIRRCEQKRQNALVTKIPYAPIVPKQSAAFFPGKGKNKKARRAIRSLEKQVRKLQNQLNCSNKPKKSNNSKNSGFYSSDAWMAIRYKVLKTYGRTCMFCKTTEGEMHVDHVKPISVAPELKLVFDNLQILCRACNLGKSNKDSDDYRNIKTKDEWGPVGL